MKVHAILLRLLYILTAVTVISIIAYGWEYYRLPLRECPHHELHRVLKPGGSIGHGLGIVGSFLILVLLLYSARKRFRFMQRWGNIRIWLNYHIWMGITGPLLIVFHTSFKIGGIVAVAFWSMVAVAVSGVLGRYLYTQIPRSMSGHELTAAELAAQERELLNRLASEYDLESAAVDRLKSIGETTWGKSGAVGWRSVLTWLFSDLRLPLVLAGISRELKRAGGIRTGSKRRLMKLIRRIMLHRRRLAFLGTAHKLLHAWHIIHKPFATVMIIIMFVHTFVAILFGYTWVF